MATQGCGKMFPPGIQKNERKRKNGVTPIQKENTSLEKIHFRRHILGLYSQENTSALRAEYNRLDIFLRFAPTNPPAKPTSAVAREHPPERRNLCADLLRLAVFVCFRERVHHTRHARAPTAGHVRHASPNNRNFGNQSAEVRATECARGSGTRPPLRTAGRHGEQNRRRGRRTKNKTTQKTSKKKYFRENEGHFSDFQRRRHKSKWSDFGVKWRYALP